MARKSKKQTLAEFQAFLQGIVEIQPEEWTPDATQWKMIYEKILNIKEPVVVEQIVTQQAPVPQGYPQQALTYAAPPVPTHMPHVNPADIEMSPAAKEMLATGKTPNTDANSPSTFE